MKAPFGLLFTLEHLAWQQVKTKISNARESRYSLFTSEISYLANSVKTVHSLTEAKSSIKELKIPVVWKRAAADQPVVKNWSLNYLIKFAGDKAIKLLSLDGLSSESKRKDKRTTLRDFIRQIDSCNDYLRFSDLFNHAPGLKNDLPLSLFKKLSDNPRRINWQFFLGPTGSYTPLHAEMNYNIFLQIFGTKEWIFFPPETARYLSPPSAHNFYFSSKIDPFKCVPDREHATRTR